MIGELLLVTIQGENSQRILLVSSHKQWSSPMSATYENQALENSFIVILSPFGALHCLWADTRMFLFSSILVLWAARMPIMQSWSYYWP